MLCDICHQPECLFSCGGLQRPRAGAMPSKLLAGEREYRGYQEWAVHPEEAMFVLHRGYALVDGEKQPVSWIHNEAFITQIRVYGSDIAYTLEAKYWESPNTTEMPKERNAIK